MSRGIEIDTGREIRRVRPEALPLAVGGPDADVPLAGVDAAEAVAWIGLADDRLFLQSAGSESVVCNGAPVKTSQWLYDGDVIRIGVNRILVALGAERTRFTLQRPSSDNPTVPPSVSVTPPAAPPDPPRASAARGTAPEAPGAPRTVKAATFEPTLGRAARPARRRIRPVVWLLSLPVLVLALVAWFLLTARSVEIVVEPEPDRLEFRAGLSRLGISLGGRHLVRPGTYTLRAAKEGYRDLEQTVVVTRESSQSYTFSLRKLPGLLVVDVGGIRGARISIDGEEVARTPATALELEPGEHDLQITSERHRPFATRVAVEGGGATQTLTAELVPRWAPVAFSTRPSGATIRANGEDVGLTPATVDLIEGTYSIELALAGHRTHRRRIEVVAGEPLTLPAVALEPADGRLVLHSDPTGATVTVDGVFRGTTPLDVPLEPGRPHEVELRKPGYETRTTSVTVRSGRTAEEEVTLPALLGEVDVRATPADAELIVDGTSRGDANRTLRLVAVPHEIEVRKEGYESYSTTVTPRPGLPQRLEVTLRSTEKIRAEATPPRIRTSQGRELVLVQGGRLRMGASRREPGRRSNETLREVELTRPFYIATREVSNAEFREFREDHSSGKAGGVSLEVDHHPVVRVTWEDAARYCNWLSAKEGLPLAYEMRGGAIRLVQPATTGYRLPTEAEWAFAARYGGGTTRLKYAWGDSLPPPAGSGNFGDRSAAGLLPDVIDGYDDGWPGTAPVGSFAPNALGLFNLGGNVAEWVHDRYTVYTPSRAGEVEHDPLGPVDGDGHVIRGAGWMDAVLSDLRLSFRDHGSGSRPDVGFRIARYAE